MSKKLRSVIAAGCTAAVTAGLLLPAATAAQAAEEPKAGPKLIIGLGDSYMSGEGVMFSNKHVQPSDPNRKPIVYTDDSNSTSGYSVWPNNDEYFWARDTIGVLKPSGTVVDGTELQVSDAYFDKADGSGEQIPWCHRSPVAPSHVEVPGYLTLNLACSGAVQPSVVSEQGAPKPGVDFTDLQVNGKTVPSQLNQMIAAQKATGGDIEVINLSIGGNDYGFADLAAALITNYLNSQALTWSVPGDFTSDYESQARFDTVATNVKTAIENIHQAMAQIGDTDYRIVYQTVPMPLPAPDDYTPQETVQNPQFSAGLGDKGLIGGCPVWGRNDFIEAIMKPAGVPEDFYAPELLQGDAEWIAETIFPSLKQAMLKGVADAKAALGPEGPMVVVNDVEMAMKGHEICAPEVSRLKDYTGKVYDIRNGDKPDFGPGQGADTEWMNAVGFDIGNIQVNNYVKDLTPTEGAYPIVDGLASSGEALAEPVNATYLTQVLHPNYWGQRALAACAEAAMTTPSDYIACQPHPAGGTDAKGRPLMLASAPSDFTPMAPMRVLDTRQAGGPVSAGTPVQVDLTGMIPAGTTAVSFNVTVTGQTASGYAEVAPAGAAAGSSTINWTGPAQTIANGHIVKVGAGNKVQISVGGSGTAQVVLDLTGAFTAAGAEGAAGFKAVERRVYDSRDGDGPLAAGASRTLNINDDVRAMNGASAPVAAAVNVTATGTTGSGVLTVAKAQSAATSTINWSAANATIANAVITDVAADGSFTVTNNGKSATEVIVDLTGVFTPGQGAQFYAIDPVRSYDSRTSDRPLTNTRSRVNTHPVPADAVAVAINTTITGNSGSGWLAVTDPATQTPMTSTVNWVEPTTRANGTITSAAEANTRAHVGGFYSTHYVHDVGGYFK